MAKSQILGEGYRFEKFTSWNEKARPRSFVFLWWANSQNRPRWVDKKFFEKKQVFLKKCLTSKKISAIMIDKQGATPQAKQNKIKTKEVNQK